MKKLLSLLTLISVLGMNSMIRPEPVMSCEMGDSSASCCSMDTSSAKSSCDCVESNNQTEFPNAVLTDMTYVKPTVHTTVVEIFIPGYAQSVSHTDFHAVSLLSLLITHDPPHLRAPPALL